MEIALLFFMALLSCAPVIWAIYRKIGGSKKKFRALMREITRG